MYSSGILQFDSYRDWFNAIVNNDNDYLVSRLRLVTESEKDPLLTGTFEYNDITGSELKRLRGQSLNIVRPLCLAAAFGANNVL